MADEPFETVGAQPPREPTRARQDELSVTGIECFAHHGVFEHEKREGQDEWGLVDAVGVVVAVTGVVVLFETLFAEEGFEPEPEHVEGSHSGGDEADEPEQLADWVR